MKHSKPRMVVAALILAAAVAAGALIAADCQAPATPSARSEEFQRLVGGLGFGPAVDLSRCAFSFDPRLCADCPLNHGPAPGGVYFCSQHACAILYYPPLRTRPADATQGEGDGRSP